MFLAGVAQAGISTEKHTVTRILPVLHGFLDFCSAFFAKTFLAVKYLALSFLGSTSEMQGEKLITA